MLKSDRSVLEESMLYPKNQTPHNWLGFLLFTYLLSFLNLNKNENTTKQSLNWKKDKIWGPIDMDGKVKYV